MGKERSCTGPLCVSVTFPDGYKDDLVLSKFHANEEDRIANVEHCNYIGHLAKEPEACVAMTGCFGSENVHLTILSAHAPESSMFKWTKDGNVEIIESSFKVHTYFLHFLIPYENNSNNEYSKNIEWWFEWQERYACCTQR